MKLNCSIFFCLVVILILSSSCSPRDFVRNNQLLRILFYPSELQPGYKTGDGLGADTDGESFNYNLYGELLEKHVNKYGLVDYRGLSKDEAKLNEYLDLISGADYESLSRYEKLAFLINAYNAFTLKLIINHQGISSIKDIPSEKRWENTVWSFSGEKVSLNDIEHQWIRAGFGEPKIHFALVCASISCPQLRREPYTGDKLLQQLNDQAKGFFGKEENFRWDSKSNTLYLSEILDWYRYDFAENERGVLNVSLNFTDSKKAAEIRSEMQNVMISYIPYNWNLNGYWQ